MNTALTKATSRYGDKTQAGLKVSAVVPCPVPGCVYIASMQDNQTRLPYHHNLIGFCCDGSGLSPEKAAALQIDEQGRLLNADEELENFDDLI